MPGLHAALSPSASKRWLTCPPSARLNQKFTERFGEKSSEFAEEGTQAHALCELKLRKELGEINEFSFNEQKKALGEFPSYAEANTDYYVDIVLEKYYAAKKKCEDARLFVEQKLDMSTWVPGCFGTSDAVIVSDSGLEVIDYKNGQGVPVSAVDNSQMRLYALGAVAEFGALYDFKDVRYTIVQPRLDSVSDETLTLDELLAWGDSIKPAAELAWKGEGEFKEGDHCRFCNVKALCKTRVLHMLDVATSGFESPDLLTDKAIGDMLPYLDPISKWIEDVKKYALSQALQGVTYSGYKIVRGRRPGRAWKNEDDVLDQLCRAGYSESQYNSPSKLKSVNEMEKMMGKKAFDALLGKLTIQGEGAPTLVPEEDSRPVYNDVATAFADLNDN